jgi:hypothetical protein
LTTDLRLLLDECLQGELASEIQTWGKVRAEWVCDNAALRSRGTTDESLMAYAQRTKSIFVTVEGRVNEQRFEICTHRGILVFRAARRHEAAKALVFRKFMLCGKRKLCKHAVTYLKSDEIIFRRKGENGRLYDTTVKIY